MGGSGERTGGRGNSNRPGGQQERLSRDRRDGRRSDQEVLSAGRVAGSQMLSQEQP